MERRKTQPYLNLEDWGWTTILGGHRGGAHLTTNAEVYLTDDARITPSFPSFALEADERLEIPILEF